MNLNQQLPTDPGVPIVTPASRAAGGGATMGFGADVSVAANAKLAGIFFEMWSSHFFPLIMATLSQVARLLSRCVILIRNNRPWKRDPEIFSDRRLIYSQI